MYKAIYTGGLPCPDTVQYLNDLWYSYSHEFHGEFSMTFSTSAMELAIVSGSGWWYPLTPLYSWKGNYHLT